MSWPGGIVLSAMLAECNGICGRVLLKRMLSVQTMDARKTHQRTRTGNDRGEGAEVQLRQNSRTLRAKLHWDSAMSTVEGAQYVANLGP